MVNLVFAWIVSLVIHLAAMAIALHLSGVQLQRISFGIGPTIFRIGIVTVSPFLLSGSVTMLDSRVASLSEQALPRAFNYRPMWVQVLSPLSGVGALCLLGYLLIGPAMPLALLTGFKQVFNVFSQTQLRNIQLFCETHSFATVLGFTATKLAAFNLLPLPGFNGGQALINFAKRGRPTVGWEKSLLQWSLWPSLLLLSAWVQSVAVYIVGLIG